MERHQHATGLDYTWYCRHKYDSETTKISQIEFRKKTPINTILKHVDNPSLSSKNIPNLFASRRLINYYPTTNRAQSIKIISINCNPNENAITLKNTSNVDFQMPKLSIFFNNSLAIAIPTKLNHF